MHIGSARLSLLFRGLMRNELWPIMSDRRFWRGPAPWIVALLVLANAGVWHWKSALDERRRVSLAAGDPEAFILGRRYETTFGVNPLSTWSSIPDARKQPLVIICGMSQMFSINERQQGDQTISEAMDDSLGPKGVRVFGLAAPNLCNEEALFLLLALLDQPETTPATFIYGACFDKFRNVDLRPGYQTFLRASPDLQATWKRTAEGFREKYPKATDKMLQSLKDLDAVQDTGDSFEVRLRKTMAACVPVVAARKDLNGEMQTTLFLLRNAVLRIKPTSKRPIINARYDMNREFLQMMIDLCHKAGVRFITYIIPLNPLAENPYIPHEYKEFKNWLGGVARARRIPFANLENLVPSNEWGEFMGGPDFKHFKGTGHRRTAAQLLEEFGPSLTAACARETTP
jgi:hypothetical protein